MVWGTGSVYCDGGGKCWCGCWLLFFGSMCVEFWDDTKAAIRFLYMGSSQDDCGCSSNLDGELGFWKEVWEIRNEARFHLWDPCSAVQCSASENYVWI